MQIGRWWWVGSGRFVVRRPPVPASRLSLVALLGASGFGPDGNDDLSMASTGLHCWVYPVLA